MPVDEFGMTGSGREFEVMGFVKQCMDVCISGYEPKILSFSAEEFDNSNSRAQTYTRMFRRYLEPK